MKSALQALTVVALSAVALSSAAADSADSTPFKTGAYIAPMATGVFHARKSDFGNGYGGTVGIGYRKPWYAMELAPTYTTFGNIKVFGGGVNALLFPIPALANTYALVGISSLQYKGVDTNQGNKDYNTLNAQGGVGQLWPLRFGNYDFAVRTEVLYRYGNREAEYNDQDVDLDVPRRYQHVVANLGLYLPLGINRVAAPPPAPEQPAVVPVAEPVDTDGDGVIDANDQCPDTPKGTVVDETGCPPPPPPPPAPSCKAPAPGEKISLAGCGTGDSIVLRGVNFDTNKATLTVNARTLLDDVVAELKTYSTVNVLVAGHTDSRGSAKLNDGLSKRRAASVVSYLTSKGIAANRLSSAGFGASQPIADNATTEGQDLNRRVELKIISGTTTAAEAPAPDAAPAEAAPADVPAAQ